MTFLSLLFLITRILRGLIGQVNLQNFPAGNISSYVERGGTSSGFKKGNVGGRPDVEGGCCRKFGVIRFGNKFVERKVVVIPRHCCVFSLVLKTLIMLVDSGFGYLEHSKQQCPLEAVKTRVNSNKAGFERGGGKAIAIFSVLTKNFFCLGQRASVNIKGA